MNTKIFFAILLSIITLIIGYFIAKHYEDGTHFARSGSAVVIIAVIFAASDLKNRIKKAPGFAKKRLRDVTKEKIAQYKNSGLSTEQAEGIFQSAEEETLSDIQDMVDKYIDRILKVELSIALVGTFIWGFGDLFI